MPYRVKNMNESSYVKPPRRFGIHSSSLTKEIHKSMIARLIFSFKNMRSSQSQVKKLMIVASQDLMLLAKVTTIEEAKELATLPLNELIGNLKVYETILENDGVAPKTTKEKVKSLALKAKVTREQTSDDSDSQGGSDEDIDQEEAEAFNLIIKNFHKFFYKNNRFGRGNQFGNGDNRFGRGRGNSFGNKGGESSRQRRGCYNYGEEGHFISECPNLKENKSLSKELGAIAKTEMNHKTMQHVSRQSTLKRLFTSYKAYDGGHVIFRSNLKGKVIGGGNISHDSIAITNVEHVNGLAFNLISVGQLCDDDCVVIFTLK
ncbi:retrovirus-related pol polyprotein from transposon TNT 1-94 [Tanacetum coccineum]|uniref:Retrovirus-related pol polyprotein from transposon TNT 1-94 n=1 Tax=Tanacetum coccineum TaxID=301880 RepID=A0ABQ5IHN1_9ASTR